MKHFLMCNFLQLKPKLPMLVLMLMRVRGADARMRAFFWEEILDVFE